MTAVAIPIGASILPMIQAAMIVPARGYARPTNGRLAARGYARPTNTYPASGRLFALAFAQKPRRDMEPDDSKLHGGTSPMPPSISGSATGTGKEAPLSGDGGDCIETATPRKSPSSPSIVCFQSFLLDRTALKI